MTYVNELMLGALGYNDDEIINTLRFEDVLTGGSRILYKTHFSPKLIIDKDVAEIFLSFRSKSGVELPVLINLSLIKENGSEYVVGAAMRMSKRNNFEKGLLEAKRAAETALQENALLIRTKAELEHSRTVTEKQLRNLTRIHSEQIEFNKILAHDLQEPLRKIQIFASRLLDFLPLSVSGGKEHEYLKKVLQISERSHGLIKRLQIYHALNYKTLNYETCDFEKLIAEAIVKTGHISFKATYGEMEVHDVNGDSTYLILLFTELLKNSFEYRSPNLAPVVTISTSRVVENYYQSLKGAYRYMEFVRITYRDNSLGFKNYDGTDVFRPLQKSDSKFGKGMGLAFCKKIIELHKGRVSLVPMNDGGAEFVIHIPVEQP